MLRSTPRRRLQLRQSHFQAGSRCGGRRVELLNLAGAHGRNEKPATVQSPKRRAARQAAKELINTFPVSTGIVCPANTKPGLPREWLGESAPGLPSLTKTSVDSPP